MTRVSDERMFVRIDLAKATFDLALNDQKPMTFANSDEGIQKAINWLKSLSETVGAIVLEATGGYERALAMARRFTLHAEEVPEFRHYAHHNREHPELPEDAMSILLGIVDMRRALLADTMERLHTALEALSSTIFRSEGRDMTRVLLTLPQIEDANGKARLGMLDNQRVLYGLQRTGKTHNGAGIVLADVLADMDSLMTHSNFCSKKPSSWSTPPWA